MKDNIILEIFNRAFNDATSLSINLLEDRMIKLKIDNYSLIVFILMVLDDIYNDLTILKI